VRLELGSGSVVHTDGQPSIATNTCMATACWLLGRYRNVVCAGIQDKERLKALLKIQHHYGVSPEVLRELNHGRARGIAAPNQQMLPVHARIGKHTGEDAFNMAPMLVDD
jgi:hypothetical protein